MNSMVLELQKELMGQTCDVANALQKAHVIALKLRLSEFDVWIQHELNGYENCAFSDIPEYRKVKGALNAFNPYRGWISAIVSDREIEEMICSRTLPESISELQTLQESCTTGIFQCQYRADEMEIISRLYDMPCKMEFSLHVSIHAITGIIEKVRTLLIEWTVKLEQEGVIGENMQFTAEEASNAKSIPQQINNYYAPVVHGDICQSQVVAGNHNTATFSYEAASDMITKIKASLETEQIPPEAKADALELVEEVDTKIKAQKKHTIVRATLAALKDFLISSGAGITAAMVTSYLQGMG